MWLFAWLAHAATLEDYLPRVPITTEQAAALMTADKIGPPALVYDSQTKTAPTAEEKSIEEALALGALAPSDAIRRFNRLYLELSLAGIPQAEHRWFLAEHVGLASTPEPIGVFVVSKGDVAAVVEQTKEAIEEARSDAELQSVVVSVLEHPKESAAWVGAISVIIESASFEPFPRRVEPGKIATIPGTLLNDKEKYALYIASPGTEVRSFPLSGSGAFDIEVPLPGEAGRYRVAMQRQRKGVLPDSPFFFTLYVGIDPPTAFQASDWGITPSTSQRVDDVEKQFASILSERRVSVGLGELGSLDGSAALRTLLEGIPAGSPRKRRRYLESALSKDPLPGVPHGTWAAVFGSGYSEGEAAWQVIEHPLTRSLVFDNKFDKIGVGAVQNGSGYDILGILTVEQQQTGESRQLVWDALAQRWTGAPPRTSPRLEEGLDTLAAEIGAGKGLEWALKKIKPLAKGLSIPGYASWIFEVPTGEMPDLSKVTIPDTHRVLAIGDATGERQAGIRTTILIVMSAPTAP